MLKSINIKIKKNYESKHNIKYDSITFRNFNELDDHITILSEKHLYFKNLKHSYVKDLDLSERKYIFEKVFNNKVFDYDSLLLDNISINGDNLMLIPSCIHAVNFSGAFSSLERFKQTKEQLTSIQKLDKTCSILLEMSELNLNEIYELLSTGVNYIILFCKNQEVEHLANRQNHKSLPEISVQVKMFDYIKDKNFKWYCKFGGRYKLHDNFNISDFQNNIATLKVILPPYSYSNAKYAEAIFYSIPKHQYEYYINHLKDSQYIFDIEHELCNIFTEWKQVDQLNIIGYQSYSKYNAV